MKSCKFFLMEFEEMKSCIYIVETKNAGMGLRWFWHHLFKLLLEETVLFMTKGFCIIQYLTRDCNHYPKLTLHIAGLRVNNGKSVIVKSWNKARRKKATVPILEQWDTVDYLLERNSIPFRCFFQQHQNFSTATGDVRSPTTMSSVTCSRGKVKFSSSLSDSATSSG